MDNRRYDIDGNRVLENCSEYKNDFSVFIDERTSLTHDSMVRPAWIGNDTFVGMKSLVFNAKGNGVAVGVFKYSYRKGRNS